MTDVRKRRLYNTSRRWVVAVTLASGGVVEVEAGYASSANADAIEVRCDALEIVHNGKGARAWDLSECRSDAFIRDNGDGAPELFCAGAAPVDEAARVVQGVFAASESRTAVVAPPAPIAQEIGWVTVLGAGIAGLTAAHELAERGFRVQVVEREHGAPTDAVPTPLNGASLPGLTVPDVGGIARTQWATEVLGGDTAAPTSLVPVHGNVDWDRATLRAASPTHNVLFTREGALASADPGLDAWWNGELRGGLRDRGDVRAAIQLVAAVYTCDEAEPHPFVGPAAAYERLRALHAAIVDHPASAALVGSVPAMPVARAEIHLTREEYGRVVRGEVPLAGAFVRHFESPELIAGEHGFRFFPGFYRHLRDTMRRTPVLDDTNPDHNVHEHLNEVEWQVLADPTRQHPAAFARRGLPRAASAVEQYQLIRRELGYRPSDMLRFTLRMLRYATSSPARRHHCYEKLSWWDFLSLRDLRGAVTDLAARAPDARERLRYGRRFAATLRHAPRALVAMDATVTDARTQGNISIQLARDQFDLHDQTDSTLQAPTSEAWLRHWREYLVRLGVRFHVGEVVRIRRDPQAAKTRVDIAFPQGDRPRGYFDDTVEPHYYVCALDLVSAARVCAGWAADLPPAAAAATVPGRLGAFVREVGPAAPGVVRDPASLLDLELSDGDRLQTLTGVQLYYRRRTSFARGHLYYVFSPWGLSAVSQVQFWRPLANGQGPASLLGNLSVDIGSWRAWHPSDAEREWLPRKDFWQDGLASPSAMSPREIAEGVSKQVLSCAHIGEADIPKAHAFHIDEYIDFEVQPGGRLAPRRNRAPFLINAVGDWENRPPGDPWSPNAPRFRGSASGRGEHLQFPGAGAPNELVWSRISRGGEAIGYRVHTDNLVFCGAWTRTMTRLGTMEAANESARHAVNAILDHRSWRKDPRRGGRPGALETVRPAAPDRPGIQPMARTTPYGEYCDIWDPEDHESADLDFVRLVDQKVMEEYLARVRVRAAATEDDLYVDPAAPALAQLPPAHLFDRLGLDRLPDLVEDDAEAITALSEIDALLATLRGTARADIDAGARAVDAWRERFEAHLAKLYKKVMAP